MVHNLPRMVRKAQRRSGGGFLNGRLLIAMPTMTDPCFEKSVVLICHHTPETAMGIVLNRAMDGLTFDQLMKQLNLEAPEGIHVPDMAVHFGGPVQPSRGFVLHSDDYRVEDATLAIADGIALTATMDALKALTTEARPQRALFALGYAGWAGGQLESELQTNAWLIGEPDPELVFAADLDRIWAQALARIGVDPGMVANASGRA
jgi:putative transcriptional regulator